MGMQTGMLPFRCSFFFTYRHHQTAEKRESTHNSYANHQLILQRSSPPSSNIPFPGNTVILGLSASGLPDNPYAWLTTLISLATFLFGVLLTFRISTFLCPLGPSSNRLWTGTLFHLQGLLILLSAALSTPRDLIPQNPSGTSTSTPRLPGVEENVLIVSLIPPLAFQAGMQIATSRLLGFNELPVNVVTSTYCDIMGDFKLLALNNVKRNRRVAAAVLLLIGAIASGWMMRSRGGLMSVFWVAGGIKILVGLAVWGFMPAAKMEK